MMSEQPLDLGLQGRKAGEVVDADGAATDLVLISRPDAPAGCANPAFARRRLADLVELAMKRQNERGVAGDAQIVSRDADALRCELVDLREERPRIDHHAVADDRQFA